MNTVNFSQTGGIPFDANTLSFMQESYNIFQAFGELIGEKTKLKGCVKTGSNVSDGVIYLNGELLDFKGGIEQSSIIVVEEDEELEFEDGIIRPLYKKRYATFGSGVDSIDWSDFKFHYSHQPIVKEVKWVGRSITNNDLPNGWYIANGLNGTDNILGRMIVGQDSTQDEFDIVGKTGGEKNVTLTNAQIPAHAHEFTADKDFGGTQTTVGLGGGSSTDKQITTSQTGGGEAHNNLPPYIVMIPIQFIG